MTITKSTKKLSQIMSDRMREEGWDSVRHFTEGSRVPFSLETTRRIFNECSYKNLAPYSVAIIAKYLNFNPPEIKVLLQSYTDDQDLYELMGTDDNVLTEDERAVVEFYREVTSKGPEAKEDLVAQFKTAGKLAGVDTKELVNKLGGKG